ncbi:uncharacterized protein LOC143275032 [Babylonia areolata]|uniref:uncharacterized protein LOC143275032 n=1 Tax=Babylonia areolata TaxID=304850 RepID=UPI003FD27F82
MDKGNVQGGKTSPRSNLGQKSSPQMSARCKDSHHHHHHQQGRRCERRERLHNNNNHHHTSGPPIIHHPEEEEEGEEEVVAVEHAQRKEKRVFPVFEDSRPMFSPVPARASDTEGEEGAVAVVTCRASRCREKVTFPAIQVDRCVERTPPPPPPSSSPSLLSPQLTPRRRAHTLGEGHRQAAYSGRSPSAGGLNVPSPYQACQSEEGRVLLLTQDSNRSLLGSWSRSEGHLPEAVRRAHSSPGSHSNLLDIRYRPDWQAVCSGRPSSDQALHELTRGQQGYRDSPTTTFTSTSPLRHHHHHHRHPRTTPTTTTTTPRLPTRLEPLNPALGAGPRALSASNLHSP